MAGRRAGAVGLVMNHVAASTSFPDWGQGADSPGKQSVSSPAWPRGRLLAQGVLWGTQTAQGLCPWPGSAWRRQGRHSGKDAGLQWVGSTCHPSLALW